MSNYATYGYGLRTRIRRSGPSSYGMDGLLAVLYAILSESTSPADVGVSDESVPVVSSQSVSASAVAVRSAAPSGSSEVPAEGVSSETPAVVDSFEDLMSGGTVTETSRLSRNVPSDPVSSREDQLKADTVVPGEEIDDG